MNHNDSVSLFYLCQSLLGHDHGIMNPCFHLRFKSHCGSYGDDIGFRDNEMGDSKSNSSMGVRLVAEYVYKCADARIWFTIINIR